mgnify:FL=1|tara:strand:- start:222 stop:470 length:249 start_codon:yes stop_codon:yes gene_type:complete
MGDTAKSTAPEVGTVVVSCSALILESKQIVNDEAVNKKLDRTLRVPSFVAPHPGLLGLALQAPGCTTHSYPLRVAPKAAVWP